MRRAHWLLPAAVAAALAFAPATPARGQSGSETVWTAPAGATVYTAPAQSAGVLARLPGNQPVRVVPYNAAWGRTLLWNAVPAWLPLGAGVQPRPWPTVPSAYTAPPLKSIGPHAPMSLSAHGHTREPANLRLEPSFVSARVALVARGAPLHISAWATDSGGEAWYQVTTARGSGWLYGDAVTFDTAALAEASPAALRGKGMWFTYTLLDDSPASAIVAAARAAGLSHLYVEVGRSGGFYGANGLARLLPLAHRAGIRVIAWVYPYLEDVPGDVAMSVAAARYVAPTGDRPDGLLADVEEITTESAVRAYGQVLRAMLGPRQLMAIATFPPQSIPGGTYPFATAALSWNAIVPMDYWHLRRAPYSAAAAYDYVRASVSAIRKSTSAGEPVEVLGQMFDFYESGDDYPSAAEINASAAAARAAGAVGVSYFEWNHATADEWAALARLRYP